VTNPKENRDGQIRDETKVNPSLRLH